MVDSDDTHTWRRIDGYRRIWRLGIITSQFSYSISDVVGIEGASVVGKHATRRRDSDPYATIRGEYMDRA